MTTPTKRCDTCRWWGGLPVGRLFYSPGRGDCRRRAPVCATHTDSVLPGDVKFDDPRSMWPQTTADAWCGDWAKKSAPVVSTEPAAQPSAVCPICHLGIYPLDNVRRYDSVGGPSGTIHERCHARISATRLPGDV